VAVSTLCSSDGRRSPYFVSDTGLDFFWFFAVERFEVLMRHGLSYV
jgi:hypothetical protein